ncbi:ricin-type beta-trefoil lectin domain protein [Streptomyces sp. NPDC052682]|uniref:RICIN domain-containing protein n=1 Tax=Streptomyces sp. NPDC052682 TaxID=3154954 RepID=UPI0034344549
MKDAGLSHSPASARQFPATDEQLSAELRKWTGATPAPQPVGELLDRHWEAAFAYARLCTNGSQAAGMLTTAAFTRLLGETLRQNGPTTAWRPHLLATVRRIAAEWDGDSRRDMLHPGLLAETADGERLATRLQPPCHRRLLSGAFQRLPESARGLLWRAEVEAEPLAAALPGHEEDDARADLDRARERLRMECLQLHRELAPDEECRRYVRLLDVTCRRGGVDIDPDLRTHLEGCGHCRNGADQLDQFNRGLGIALAEAVLGWGARDYVLHRVGALAGPEPAQHPFDEPGTDPDGPAAAHPQDTTGEAFPGPAAGGPLGPEALAAQLFPEPADGAGSVAGGAFPGAAGRAGGVPADGFPGAAGHLAGVATEAYPAGGAGGGPAERIAGESFTDPVGGAAPAPGDFPGPPVRTTPETLPPVPRTAPRAATGTAAHPAPDTTVSRSPSRSAARRSAQKAARRAGRRRNLTVGILTVGGLIVLPLGLWAAAGSGDGTPPAGDGLPAETPESGTSTSSGDPSWAGAGDAVDGALRGRMHNVSSDLCVGLVGGKAVEGAEAELTACSSAPAQQWTYETDGLLRSVADPALCLNSRLGYSVRLAPCGDASGPDAKDVRYDFTLQGALVPRWGQNLALAPAATDGSGALVVKNRVDDDTQRWAIETSRPDLQMEAVRWEADASSPAPSPTPKRGTAPSRAPAPTPAPRAATTPPPPRPAPSAPYPAGAPCYGSSCPTDDHNGRPGYGDGYGGYGYGGYGGYGGGSGYGSYGGHGGGGR